MNNYIKKSDFNYKYLIYISMLLITLKLLITILVYKTISVFNFTTSLSIVLMPLWFFMLTIITEVYGYQITKKLIIFALICQAIFVLTYIIIDNKSSYLMPRIVIAGICATLSGSIIGSYILDKYKIIVNGKYFLWRILLSTIVGQFIYTVIADIIAFVGIKNYIVILELATTSFTLKLIAIPFLIIPTIIISKILIHQENS